MVVRDKALVVCVHGCFQIKVDEVIVVKIQKNHISKHWNSCSSRVDGVMTETWLELGSALHDYYCYEPTGWKHKSPTGLKKGLAPKSMPTVISKHALQVWNQVKISRVSFPAHGMKLLPCLVRLSSWAVHSSAWWDPPSTYFLQPNLVHPPYLTYSWQNQNSGVSLSYFLRGVERMGLTHNRGGAGSLEVTQHSQCSHWQVLSHSTWSWQAESGASIGEHQYYGKQ